MCLGDNKILCGRYANGCMLAHCGGGGGGGSSTSGAASAEEPPSSFPVCPLVMSFNDCSIHDYSQDSYLDMFNIKELQPHYAWLHKLKFGEEPPLPSLSQQPKEAAAGENGFYIQLEVQSPSPSSAASSSSASSFFLLGAGCNCNPSRWQRCGKEAVLRLEKAEDTGRSAVVAVAVGNEDRRVPRGAR